MKYTTVRAPAPGFAPHAVPVEEVIATLKTDLTSGLSSGEVERRLQEYGPNTLPEAKGRTILEAFRDQFANFLIILLLAATALSAAIGEYLDAAAIAAIVILSAALGVAQEWRAERALQALHSMMAPVARVLRDQHVEEVASPLLVPGDIVLLEPGQYVPADLRLADTKELKMNEASLTGESTQVDKDARSTVDPDTPIADRTNSAFAGTIVTYGRAMGVVIATGTATEVGRIAALVGKQEQEQTPLQRRMSGLGRWLGGAAIAVSAVVFAVGAIRGNDLVDMLLTAVSLAVAAVPEGLPAVVTVALAVGMQRMAQRHALIRKMSAVETLGSATVIATDKTGTLTKGEMTVVRVYLRPGEPALEVTGAGYEPSGEFRRDGETIDPRRHHHLRLLLLASVLCNDAYLQQKDERWHVVGDTTEGALLVMAAKGGLTREALEAEHPRVAEVPFTSDRRLMTTLNEREAGYVAYSKGAPGALLPLCSRRQSGDEPRPLRDEERHQILAASEELAAAGLRVLALAYRSLEQRIAEEKLEEQLIFLGLAAMQDPPRPEVRDAVELSYRAGIIPIMITGDHRATALAIGRDLRITGDGDSVLTGSEIDRLTDAELRRVVDQTRVYARISPEQKMRIVNALREEGHIVAVTGDGVNDAPALRGADIGVAMGITGTDVAKEAADMVITDDNYASIVAAVEEGRKIFDNIRNFVIYLLAANLGEILIIFAAVVAGTPVPLLPIQILWVNLVTDSFPALALGMEPADPDIMSRPPRPPQESVVTRPIALVLVIRGVAEAVAVLVAFLVWLYVLDRTEEEARTIAFATLVVAELLKAHGSRSLYRTVIDLGPFKNMYVVGATILSFGLLLLVMYVPPLPDAFEISLPDLWEWLVIFGLGSIPLIIIEVMKLMPWVPTSEPKERRARPRPAE